MKKKALIIMFLALPVAANLLKAQSVSIIVPDSMLYLGQKLPGKTPVIFAPGIVSVSGKEEHVITFSPDGSQCFFATGGYPYRVTMLTEYKNAKWTSPAIASFSKDRSVDEPSFSPDGKRVYYYSFKPSTITNCDINYSEKSDTSWSAVISTGSVLNSTSDEYHPCFVSDSSIYFDAKDGEICYSKYSKGAYQPRVILPYPINYANTYKTWSDAYVSPDESYMIFNSTRNGGYGANDLYISFRKADKTWTNPKNLGDKINTDDEYSADVTPDGKYMTFDRNKDIYWVSTFFIDSLKKTNYIPYLKSQIKDVTGYVGKTLNFVVPDSTFIDDDGNSTLSYDASLADGKDLPSWLNFKKSTRTFSIEQPGEVKILTIRITATDASGAIANCNFNINIKAGNEISKAENEIFNVYPNPNNGKFNINSEESGIQHALIQVYSAEGKLIYSYKLLDLHNAVIDLQGKVCEGLYILKICTDNSITCRKLYIK